MGAELWAALGACAGVVATLVGVLSQLPAIRAKARLHGAEADDKIVARLYRELDRLDKAMESLGSEFTAFKKASADREQELEQENRSLKQKVARLETRIRAMEEIFRIGPLTPEMQAELDKLKKIE